jgi:hypothetical protein
VKANVCVDEIKGLLELEKNGRSWLPSRLSVAAPGAVVIIANVSSCGDYMLLRRPELCGRFSDCLLFGWCGVRTPLRAIFSVPVQARKTPCTMSTGSICGV